MMFRGSRRGVVLATVVALVTAVATAQTSAPAPETAAQHDARMAWWREARFGLFIHWGLYAIPAGEWGERRDHGEWILHTAQIPVEEYDRLRERFNPVKFDPDAWVRIAGEAGMKYIVITSKHHDGFCLFDSQFTDHDALNTPFRRDILKELADACARGGLRLCFYHSIMDWHHPDYLPRRPWEKRSAAGADYERYVTYMKNQLRELLTRYGPIGVLWFDGEWDGWTHERGVDLYDYVRGLDPNILINNRVDVGRNDMQGMTRDERFRGDFGTPEQEIPPTGLPGVDWETCMTMNDHWGFNRFDENWKSSADLIRKLIDIASKGGNFLLNVGPTAEGEFPPQAIERLRDMGAWLRANGLAIYGTQAGPFSKLDWGRCTRKPLEGGDTRLFLHVFDWPRDGRLVVPGLFNDARRAFVLKDGPERPLDVTRAEDALVLTVPERPPDAIASVVVLDITGEPDVADPPRISADFDVFVDELAVTLASPRKNIEIRYTLDGTIPGADSPQAAGPLRLTETATVKARAFRGGRAVSGVSEATFTKVKPRPPITVAATQPGLRYEYLEGDWDKLPDFDALTPVSTGVLPTFEFSPRRRDEYFGFRYRGLVTVPRTGVYRFATVSDDGSRLFIGDTLVVDSDGLHSLAEKTGVIALEAGAHPITVTYFEKTGGDALEVWYEGPGVARQRLPPAALSHDPAAAATTRPAQRSLARPTPQQLAWHDLELGMFIHLAPQTWQDSESDDLSTPLSAIDPEKLDTDQWVRVAQSMGARYIVFVAKHEGGFCWWPTETTDYSVRGVPWRGGRGDVMADLAASCRKASMKLGVYLSPQDRKHGAGIGGRTKDAARQGEYEQMYRRQLTELLTRYGEIMEVWFDGSLIFDVGDILEKHAPNAVVFQGPQASIRWVGNEDGVAPDPAWNAVRFGKKKWGDFTAEDGDPDGDRWLPNECDARIRSTWFWRTDNAHTLKSVDQLMDMYRRSVGRGAVLLLNNTPDRSGLIPGADAQRSAEFGDAIRRRFGQPVAETRGVGEVLELSLPAPARVSDVVLMEDMAEGERVRRYVVEGRLGGPWRELARGTAIGHKKIDAIEPVEVEAIRLRVLEAVGQPRLRRLAAFRAADSP